MKNLNNPNVPLVLPVEKVGVVGVGVGRYLLRGAVKEVQVDVLGTFEHNGQVHAVVEPVDAKVDEVESLVALGDSMLVMVDPVVARVVSPVIPHRSHAIVGGNLKKLDSRNVPLVLPIEGVGVVDVGVGRYLLRAGVEEVRVDVLGTFELHGQGHVVLNPVDAKVDELERLVSLDEAMLVMVDLLVAKVVSPVVLQQARAIVGEDLEKLDDLSVPLVLPVERVGVVGVGVGRYLLRVGGEEVQVDVLGTFQLNGQAHVVVRPLDSKTDEVESLVASGDAMLVMVDPVVAEVVSPAVFQQRRAAVIGKSSEVRRRLA